MAMRPLHQHIEARNSRRRWHLTVLALLAGVALTAWAAQRTVEIVPTLLYPAGQSLALQPTGLYVDAHTGDVYVVDAATSRVGIFDSKRQYNFEFSTRDRLVSPRQVTVDSQGRIFVLGDARQHTLAVYDYNGEFLRYLDLTADGQPLLPQDVAIDKQDNLHVLQMAPLRVNVYSTEGVAVRDYVLFPEGDSLSRNTEVAGVFAIYGEEIVMGFPMLGNVIRFDLSGHMVAMYGMQGGAPGTLSFPIAGLPLPDGRFVALDKHRHLVQYFTADGRYEYEVGDAGLVEGSFFHPTTMVLCNDGTLLVGQTYGDRVQSVTVRTEASGS